MERCEKGALSAATEFNIDITFEGPDNEEDYETQNRMIENAVSRNVGAIILSAIDYEKNAPAVRKAAEKGIKIITVDSDVDVADKELFIATDNYSAGLKTAQVAQKLCGEQESINIGIVNYGENTENGSKRLQGFQDEIKNIKNARIVAMVSVSSNTQSATAGARKLLEENPQINVLVGFNEWSTLGVGMAIKELGLKRPRLRDRLRQQHGMCRYARNGGTRYAHCTEPVFHGLSRRYERGEHTLGQEDRERDQNRCLCR